jgi:hypothetical protein
MRYKATFAAGFAVGFLAGARAGRGAYDKIVAAGQKVASNPKVQEATGAAQARATDLAKTAAAKAPDAAKSAASTVATTVQAQASQLPGYVTTAKQAAQSKLPPRLGGTSGNGSAPDDVAPDGTLVYPVDGVVPPVNGTHYSPDTP